MYEIKGVTYSYKNQKTKIHPVYMTIKKGEFVLLAGISGCGKTTFLRCLNGLIPDFYEGIYSGDVLLDGISLRDFKRGMLAEKIGNVFQDPRSQNVCSFETMIIKPVINNAPKIARGSRNVFFIFLARV